MTAPEVYSFAFATTLVDKNPHNKNNSVILKKVRSRDLHPLFLEFNHKHSEASHDSILGLF